MRNADATRREFTADRCVRAHRSKRLRIRGRLKGLLFTLPPMMSCNGFDRLVPDYLEDNLNRTLRRRFDLHRKLCVECSAHLGRSTESLRSLLDREWTRRDAARP